jgi:hypothetical protein
MSESWIDNTFTPCRAEAHRTVMMVRGANPDRAVQIAFVRASLEGTMAAAVQILGAEDAYEVIQPLVDRVLNLP